MTDSVPPAGRVGAIAIFGAGRLGSLLAQEVIRAGTAATVFLSNRSQDRLFGTMLSLQIFSAAVRSNTRVAVFSPDALREVAVAVIAVKDAYDPRLLLGSERLPRGIERNVRTVGIKHDLPLIRDVCRKLSGFRGIVAVLTNPVDIFTVFVKEWLPDAQVFGLGLSVDAARFSFVARRAGFSCSPSDCPFGGTHIGSPIPLRSIWNTRSDVAAQSDDFVRDAMQQAMRIGPDIVRQLGFTLHDCGAMFAEDLSWLVRRDEKRAILCASAGDSNSATGFPFERGDDGAIRRKRDLAAAEVKALEMSQRRIHELVALIRRNPWVGYNLLR